MIGTGEPDILGRSVEKARQWIAETAVELGSEDRRAAYRVLKGVLHALRDRITVNEAAQLAAQLPELLRGAFYENWVPARTPERHRDPNEFLRCVAEAGRLAGETEASYAVAAVMAVLGRHVSEGEIDDVLSALPHELRSLVEQPVR
jgi:uncharacterized protein (DUF2267 family)